MKIIPNLQGWLTMKSNKLHYIYEMATFIIIFFSGIFPNKYNFPRGFLLLFLSFVHRAPFPSFHPPYSRAKTERGIFPCWSSGRCHGELPPLSL